MINKYLLTIYIIALISFKLGAQNSEINEVKHEVDFGTTGILYLDGTGMNYQKIWEKLFIYTRGRKTGNSELLFIPFFSFNYSRTLHDRVISFGFNFNEFTAKNEEYFRYNYFLSLNIGYQYADLISHSGLSLRPKISLQLNYSTWSKYDLQGNALYLSDNNPIRPAMGVGFQNRILFFKKVFLVNNIEGVYNLATSHFFIQHYFGLGYRF